MISNSLAQKVLNAALATGGDYAEIYVEERVPDAVMLENGKVESAASSKSYGCGLRILNGLRSVYGYTSDLSAKSLIGLAEKLSASYAEERKITVEKIQKAKVKQHIHIEDHVKDVPVDEKIAYLKEISGIVSGVDPRIVRVQTGLTSDYKVTQLFNAEGPIAKRFDNVEERTRVFIVAIAAGQEGIETSFAGPGASAGWNYFTKVLDYKAIAKRAGEKAIMMLTAKECPSGKYTVVIKNGWGGVLFHEACGHPLEASATSKGLSVFSSSIGKQIASPCVSAWDDGTIENGWGSDNVDTEGVPTHKNELIRDGICVGFMVDRFSGRRLNMEPNGTARRQSYRYCPTSRMSNTYIAAGKDDPEQIIKDTPLGIYVADFGGGSVQPATGEFNFSASEAYIIRDGKICEPVKGCTLIGTGQEVLMAIDRVGNDLALGQGNCGAASGSIPVNVGQPTIRLKEITVGGRGGKLE
ncbi:MAG: TldD/PmbA family protein [Erysipelotrichaceae bacterium]|nr:TldD/PmbA family protein [Erysipelotrichaceae bacterium]